MKKASSPFYAPNKSSGFWLGLSPLVAAHVVFAAAPQKAGPKLSEAGGPPASWEAVSDLSAKEVKRREEARQKAIKEMAQADQMMGLKQFDRAMEYYGNALDLLPRSQNVSREREAAMKGFRDAALQLAQVRISEGRYKAKPDQKVPSAEDALANLLKRDPTNQAALRMQERLYTPGYFNSTITPEFREDVEKVKRYLLEGNGFIESGRFDLALKRADQALDIDPYNSAARKLQEEANNYIKTHAETAYNEARSRAMRDVQKAWANPVKRYGTVTATTTTPQTVETSQVEKLRRKVQEITLPEVQFTDKSLVEVAAMLTEASRAADKSSGGQGGGVLIIANFPGMTPPGGASPESTIQSLTPPSASSGGASAVPTVSIPKIPNFKLSEILKIVTESSQTKWTVKENWVEIVPKTTPTDNLVLRSWTVSPFMFSSTAPKVDDLSSTGLGSALGGGAPAAPKTGGKRRIDPKEFLSTMNVQFTATGSTATYNPRNKTLTVYNTVEMLDLVDSIVSDSDGQSPVQIDIRAKFIEFSQSNLKELSFDWLMGQTSIHGSNSIYSGGGTTGSLRPSLNGSDYPFTIPSNGMYPNGGAPVGVYPVTSGNRSGNLALSANAIDSLLAGATGGTGLASPAAFALAGAFTDPQFQMVVRALNQRKDVDLLSSPSVTARDQEEASIDIVREFRYPTEFTPPQLPQIAAPAAGAAGGATPSSMPVTPTTPAGFVARDTGVKLKVTPSIKGDNYAIDLDLRPEVTEFEGFINYGSPIQTVTQSSAATIAGFTVASTPRAVTLTDNVINQPIFAVRRIQTNVTLLDGETIALGGLIREDVQKVDDKIPYLGDLPLVGRLFRSSVDQHIKKNLTIFVTARIIDASGQPLKTSKAETEPEEVESLTGDGPLLLSPR
jgi:general secretion pathway protein D